MGHRRCKITNKNSHSSLSIRFVRRNASSSRSHLKPCYMASGAAKGPAIDFITFSAISLRIAPLCRFVWQTTFQLTNARLFHPNSSQRLSVPAKQTSSVLQDCGICTQEVQAADSHRLDRDLPGGRNGRKIPQTCTPYSTAQPFAEQICR